jgi:hypothetical protein
MALVEPVNASEALRTEVEARPVTLEERAPEPAAEEEADEVPARRGQPDEADQRQQLDAAALRHDAAYHDGGLAGHEQADEGAGLEEREPGDRGIGPRAERARGVLERAVDVRQRDHADHHEQRRRRGEGPCGPHDRPVEGVRTLGGGGGLHCSGVIELLLGAYDT